MDLSHVTTLIGFHYWARDRMLTAVETLSQEQYERPLGSSFPSVRDTLNHLYNAEWVWYSRWNGESPTIFPANDERPDVRTLRHDWGLLEQNVRGYLSGRTQGDLDRVIEYRLMSGTQGASSLWQMVAHLVNHASYHRGQVTTMLRQLGAPGPKSTDLITFYREQAATADAHR